MCNNIIISIIIIWESITCQVTQNKSKCSALCRNRLVVYSSRFVRWELDILSKGTESGDTCSRGGAATMRAKARKTSERGSAHLVSFVRTIFSLTWRYSRRECLINFAHPSRRHWSTNAPLNFCHTYMYNTRTPSKYLYPPWSSK